MFLGQYVSKLMQETIRYLKLPYDTLAHEMSIPELVLRDAVEGKMGLTRGQWVSLVVCWVSRRSISYDPASGMVLPAGKSAFRPLLSPRTRRSSPSLRRRVHPISLAHYDGSS